VRHSHPISGHVTRLPSNLTIIVRLLNTTNIYPGENQLSSPRALCAMDAHTDIHLTRGDIRENTLAESFTVDHEHKPGDTLLNEDSASDNLSLPSSNVSHL